MTKVFVSGCYDIIHAGHVAFFKEARKLGDSLTVCFASDEVYRAWKGRDPALPEASRRAILEELRCVDEVVMSRLPPRDVPIWMDFCMHAFGGCDVLVIASDDANGPEKIEWAKYAGKRCESIPRQPSDAESTTAIRARLAKAVTT